MRDTPWPLNITIKFKHFTKISVLRNLHSGPKESGPVWSAVVWSTMRDRLIGIIVPKRDSWYGTSGHQT